MSEWIDKRVMKPGTKVKDDLIFYDPNTGKVYTGRYKNGVFVRHNTVTKTSARYWQPLPSPPQKEQSED